MSKTKIKKIKQDQELARGERLHELTQMIFAARSNIIKSYYAIGSALKEIRDEKLWKEAYESFSSYVAEIGISHSRAYRSMQIVEKFPDFKEIRDIAVGKVYAILPHITDENREELVAMAGTLSRSDLFHEMYQLEQKRINPKMQEIPKLYACKNCGKPTGVRWEELCHCGMTDEQAEYIGQIIRKVFRGEYDV